MTGSFKVRTLFLQRKLTQSLDRLYHTPTTQISSLNAHTEKISTQTFVQLH